MIAYLALCIALIGLLEYMKAVTPRRAEIGLRMLWVGLLIFLLTYRGSDGVRIWP